MFSSLTKTVLVSVAFLLAGSDVSLAQNQLPVNGTTGLISYRFTFDFDKNSKKETLYNLAKDWFYEHPEVFVRSNTRDTLKPYSKDQKINANIGAVLHEFKNEEPLQHEDPESDRLSGKVILKYNGSNTGCIRLFYVQCSIVLVAKGNQLIGEVSNFRYNHFNPRTYQIQPVFNWSGNMPCDEISTLESLRDCESCHDEFNKFYSFLTDDTNALIVSIRDYMKANKAVCINVSEK